MHMSNQNKWEDNTILDIAWKSLSLAAQQIKKSLPLTMVCTNFLPTSSTLQKRSYQDMDECVLCHQQENQDYLIQCNGASCLL